MAMRRKELALLKSMLEQEEKLPRLHAIQKCAGLDFSNGFQRLNQNTFRPTLVKLGLQADLEAAREVTATSGDSPWTRVTPND